MMQTYINESENLMETQVFFPVDFDFSLYKIRIDFKDLSQPGKITTVETEMEEKKFMQMQLKVVTR
jgi:hypothetical protein